MDLETLRHRQRTDYLFSKVACMSDLEMQSYWARFLCILVSGYLEESIRRIFGQYARAKSPKDVARYVDSQLKFFQNPNMERITQLAGAFNDNWRKRLLDPTNEQIHASVNNVNANRNLIAHGKDVGISYHSIKKDYENVNKLIEMLYAECTE